MADKMEHIFKTQEELLDYMTCRMMMAVLNMDIDVKEHSDDVLDLMESVKIFAGETCYLVAEGKMKPYRLEVKDGETQEEAIKDFREHFAKEREKFIKATDIDVDAIEEKNNKEVKKEKGKN